MANSSITEDISAMNRELRSVLHLLNPNITDRVESSQSTQKKSHDKRSSSRTFTLGDKVYARNYGQGPAWIKGTIVDASGPYNVTIEVNLSILIYYILFYFSS